MSDLERIADAAEYVAAVGRVHRRKPANWWLIGTVAGVIAAGLIAGVIAIALCYGDGATVGRGGRLVYHASGR